MNRKLNLEDFLFVDGPMDVAAAEIADKFPRLLKLRQIALHFKLHGERGFHSVVG